MECLSKGDFATFIRHLERLVAVYNLAPATAAEKSKAWLALRAVERDLEAIFLGYRSWHAAAADALSLLHDTPLGLVHSRSGGLPMRLRYYLSPYDLINPEGTALLPCTQDNVVRCDLGHTVTVTVEKSDVPCLLPTTSLMGNQPEEISAGNSVSLPARFILQLKTPMPMSLEKCKEVTKLTNFNFVSEESALPILQLIVKNRSNSQLDTANNRGLFVVSTAVHAISSSAQNRFLLRPSQTSSIATSWLTLPTSSASWSPPSPSPTQRTCRRSWRC
jgi:hypothetical protein